MENILIRGFGNKLYIIEPDKSDVSAILKLLSNKSTTFLRARKLAKEKLKMGYATFEQCFKYAIDKGLIIRKRYGIYET
jgi:hypothetical protein